jgi:CBS domain containing-hemolysin-like protein
VTASNERLLWKLLLVCNCSLKVNVQVKIITQSLSCTFVFCFVIEYMITGLKIWTAIRQFEKKRQWKTLVLPYTVVPEFFLFSDYMYVNVFLSDTVIIVANQLSKRTQSNLQLPDRKDTRSVRIILMILILFFSLSFGHHLCLYIGSLTF